MLKKLSLLSLVLTVSHISNAMAINLYQAYELAIMNDPILNVAKSRSKSDQESLSQARAQFMPNISYNYNKSKVSQTRTQGELIYPRQEFFSTNQTITLKQPIFRKNLLSQYDMATAEFKNAQEVLGNSLQEVAVRLANAYFDLLLAKDRHQSIKSQIALYEAQSKYSEDAFKAGVGIRTDIDAFKANLNQAIADEIEIIQDIDYFKQQLSFIVGENVDDINPLDEDRFDPIAFEIGDLETWSTKAMDQNLLLAAYKSKMDVAQAGIKAAEAGHYPTLDLVAQYSKSDSENLYFQGTQLDAKSIGVQLNVPIFSGGYVNSRAREAQADFDESQFEYQDTQNRIRLDVRKNYNVIKEGRSQIKALEDLVYSDEQLVISNKKGFLAGNRTTLDILNSENRKFESNLKLKEARYNVLKAWITLNSYISGTNTDFFAELNRNFIVKN